MLCTVHKHSSERSAKKCYEKGIRRWAAWKTRDFVEKKVLMHIHKPPRVTKHGEVWMVVFIEDLNMPY